MDHALLVGMLDRPANVEEQPEALAQSVVAEEAALVKQDLLSLPLREAREEFERAYLKKQLVLCGGKVVTTCFSCVL